MRALASHADPGALAAACARIAELEDELARLKGDRAAEFWTRYHGRFRRIEAEELDWIEAERDYVRLHTAGASFLHSETLGSVEARLPAHVFRRVHRSAIVRWDRAREIRRGQEGRLTIVTGLGTEVPVGRSFAPQLLASLTHATM
jgi:two-component system, LytTR family, response regulator